MSKLASRLPLMDHEVERMSVISKSLTNPNVISFGGGAPALEAYPMETLAEIAHDVFKRDADGYLAVKYSPSQGFPKLREGIRDYLLKPRGLDVDIDEIMVTTGGIQPMNFVCQLLIEPGDKILVENPSFLHSCMIFKMFEADLIPCEMDEEGLIPEDVAKKIEEYNPKFIYTIPTFHNPTGVTQSLERRQALADIAEKYDIVILEDDPYREIRYNGEDLPYIKSLDKSGNVILANSFSKIFAPGSRLGYIVADKKFMHYLNGIVLGTNSHPSGMAQAIAAEFFARGLYPQHLENLKNIYRSRKDTMLKAIDESFPEGTHRTTPVGGYYVWVKLPGGLNADELSDEINEKLNIVYGLGSTWYVEGNGNPEGIGTDCMRLNFSGVNEETIDTHIRKLGEFFCQKLAEKQA